MFNTALLIFITVIPGLFLAWLFFFEYFRYRVDLLRHDLSVTKDSLLKYASERKIDSNHPAYKKVTDTIDALIYYAAAISLLNIVLTKLAIKKFGLQQNIQKSVEAFQSALNELDDSQRKFIERTMYTVHVDVCRFLIFTNPFLFPFALIADFLINHRPLIKQKDSVIAVTRRIAKMHLDTVAEVIQKKESRLYLEQRVR